MATDDLNKTGKRLSGHPEPAKIEAHEEAGRLGYTPNSPEKEEEIKKEIEAVPAVTADVDENPKIIKYGAAVLLGLAFGVGCYIWYSVPADNAIDKARLEQRHARAATEAYFNDENTRYDPYVSPFEPTLDGGYEEASFMEVSDDAPAPLPELSADNVRTGSFTAPDGTNVDAAVIAPGDGSVVYLFEYASADVPENKELTAIAEHATKNGLCLDVSAYTDEQGNARFNRKLSEKRARAIADYLVAHGIPSKDISVHAMGPTHKFGSFSQNRRAEVIEIHR